MKKAATVGDGTSSVCAQEQLFEIDPGAIDTEGTSPKPPTAAASYTVTEAAAMLGVSPTTIRRAIASAAITALRGNRGYRIPVAEIERLFARLDRRVG